MGLDTVFSSAVDTLFVVFKDFVCKGEYSIAPVDSGWDDSPDPVTHEMDVIVNGLTQSELKNTSFYSQIAPTDTVIMIKGSDIEKNSIRIRNSDSFKITHKTYTQDYLIIDHDTDPAEALFLVLLREK